MTRLLAILILAAATLTAQSTTTRTVQATGTATITANPDQAQLNIGVVTNGTTAQDASQQNATMTTAVLTAVKAVLGSTGKLQTVSYYVSPRYSTAPGQSIIVGYTVTNTIQVTTTDLTIIGKLIDAASLAGANSVSDLSFGLQDPEPRLQQALSAAAKQAVAHASSIAAGLGGGLGPVLSAQQSSAYAPILAPSTGAGVAATTPVQTGTVNVYATVTVTAQLQ